MTGDGRLDLDELGEVIDHASTLDDQVRHEVIDDGTGITWAERLEDAGVTPWLRRHRVAVASVAAVAVVAAAGVVVVRALVPPPIDPELRVLVTPVVPAQYVIGDSMQPFDQAGIYQTGPSLRSAYALTVQDRDDTSTYTIDGVIGPGVRATSASRQPPPSGDLGAEVARQDVDVVVDCFDVEAPIARGSYGLLVTRTDDRGRRLTRTLPLDDPVANWPAYITASCLATQSMFALSPRSVEVSADRASHVVRADVTVDNALTHAAIVTSSAVYGTVPLLSSLAPTTLAARRGGELPLRFTLRDCANPSLQDVGMPSFPGDDRYAGGGPGIYLEGWFPSVELDPGFDPSGQGGRMSVPLLFTRQQARQIDTALASLCDGAPAASLRVTDVGLGRTVTGVFPDGNPVTTRLPVTLVVTAPGATRVRISTDSTPTDFQSLTTRVAAGTAAVRDGRATVTTFLDADCQTGYIPPPVAEMEVTTARGTFPVQLPVNDTAITESLAVNCPSLPLEQLVEFGWSDPRVP